MTDQKQQGRRPNPQLEDRYSRAVRISGAAAAAINAIVLAGWVFDIPLWKSFLPDRIETKFITASTGMVTATALLLLSIKSGSRRVRSIATVLAALAALMGILSAAQYVFDVDLRIDRLLIAEAPGAVDTVNPGRMAPNTALAFVLLGIALLWSSSRRRLLHNLAFGSGVVVFLISLVAFLGHAYDARGLQGLTEYSPMALPTAISLMLLAIGTIATAKEAVTLELIFSDTPAGAMTRRLIPFAILAPALLGWIRLMGEQEGLYSAPFGVALFAVANIVVFLLMIGWTGHLLYEEDRRRAIAEQRLRLLGTMQHEMTAVELDLSALTELIARRTAEMTRASGAMLETRSDGAWHVRAAVGNASPLLGSSRVADVAAGAAIEVRNDEAGGCRLTAPIAQDEKAIAIIHLFAPSGQRFSESDVEAMDIVRGIAGIALSHALEFEERQRQLDVKSSLLDDATEMFRAFMENAPAIAFLKDAEGRMVYLNRRFEELFGVTMDQIRGKRTSEWLGGDAPLIIRRNELKVLESGLPQESFETISTADGVRRQWLMLRFPVALGGAVHVGGMGVDVTKERDAEDALRRLNAELEQRVTERTSQLAEANKELEAFSYSVSHDLRAPLRAVAGYARIVAEDYAPSLDDEGRRFIQTIQDEAKRMGMLIDDLLAFSRLSRQALSAARVDVAELAGEVFDQAQRASFNSAARLIVGELPAAMADRSLLRQVLVNLISNALKFSANQPEPRIEIRGESRGSENWYVVSDNGVGFDMQYVDKLFGVFQRLHGYDEFEGTGVGLAIVQRVIQRHGGRVWATGKIGEGASFYFTLPAADVTAKPAERGDVELAS